MRINKLEKLASFLEELDPLYYSQGVWFTSITACRCAGGWATVVFPEDFLPLSDFDSPCLKKNADTHAHDPHANLREFFDLEYENERALFHVTAMCFDIHGNLIKGANLERPPRPTPQQIAARIRELIKLHQSKEKEGSINEQL